MQENCRQARLAAQTLSRQRPSHRGYLHWAALASALMFAPMCSAEEENKIVVQEWHKQGLVAALTDPNPRTVAVAWVEQRNLPLIPATLKTLDEGARQKLVPALEKWLTHSNVYVIQSAAQALGQLGATQSIPALEKLLTDSDADVVPGAAQALGQLGAKDKAIPALEKLLTHSYELGPIEWTGKLFNYAAICSSSL